MDQTKGFTPALGFHALTPLYDRVVALTTREQTIKRALLDQAAIEPGQQVLDVGCGTGTLVIAAQRLQPGEQVWALDADPAVLAIAALEALQIFCSVLGAVAGNLALTLGARGGVYIGGGVVPRLGTWFDGSPFRGRFEAKGRFETYLREIPVWVITAQQSPALLGAARALDARP